MISKELLSEVLNVHVRPTFYFDCETLVYEYDKIKDLDECYKSEINIHELAHKCKEWAFKQGFMFDIQWHTNRNPFSIVIKSYGKDSQFYCAETEPEAIFKACEWILKENRGRRWNY